MRVLIDGSRTRLVVRWKARLESFSLHTIIKMVIFSAPSRAPVIVQVHATGPSKISLAWRPVPLPFIHGQLRGFRILINKLGQEGEQIENTTRPDVKSIEYDNLQPLTNYSLSVLAFNENGDGPSSCSVYVETMPQSKSKSKGNFQFLVYV
jgi:hypothetical protein